MTDPSHHLARGAGAVAALALLVGCGSTPPPAASDADSVASTSTPTGTPTGTPSSTPPSPRSTPPTSRTPPPPVPAAPTSVRIPALGIDEELIDLEITDTGALEVPSDPSRVGWFTGGGRPRGPGPTVVVGHLDSVDGPAVFARLPELAAGDRIEVTTGDGRLRRYVVADTRDVPQTPFPTEQVFGATATDVLRLITCTGPYDSAAGRYTENRIVTAVPG